MKKIFSLTLLLILLLSTINVSAQSTTTYTSSDLNSPISELKVSDKEVYLTINEESEYADSIKIFLANFSNQTLSEKISPDLESSDIEAMQVDLVISINSARDSLDLDNGSSIDLIHQLQSKTSGIFPLVDPQGNLVFWINNSELIETDDELKLRLYDSDLLIFTLLDEGLGYEGFVLELAELNE